MDPILLISDRFLELFFLLLHFFRCCRQPLLQSVALPKKVQSFLFPDNKFLSELSYFLVCSFELLPQPRNFFNGSFSLHLARQCLTLLVRCLKGQQLK